jgi:hypothetical protein
VTRPKKRRSPLAVALAFAGHLDGRRFGEAQCCLAEDCVYERSSAPSIVGATEIINSYRETDAAGTEVLDELRYTSRVEWADAETVAVEFTDYLRCGERFHTFVSRQYFTVRDGLIQRIVGTESPAERRSLEAFFANCGVAGRVAGS